MSGVLGVTIGAAKSCIGFRGMADLGRGLAHLNIVQ